MSASNLARRIDAGNQYPPTSERRPRVFEVTVTADQPRWGFGFARHGAPSVDFEGMTLPNVLHAFRDAWRRCNGEPWAWVMTVDGRLVTNDPDELIDTLDEVNLGDRAFVVVRVA